MRQKFFLKTSVILLTIFLVAGCVIFYQIQTNEDDRTFLSYDPCTLIPSSATTIIETDYILDAIRDFESIKSFSDSVETHIPVFISKLIDFIGNNYRESIFTLNRNMTKVLLSIHPGENDSDDYVFYCFYNKNATSFIKQFVNKNCVSSLPLSIYNYRNNEIRTYEMNNKEKISFFYTSHLFVISYNPLLLQEVIDCKVYGNSVLEKNNLSELRHKERPRNILAIYQYIESMPMGSKDDAPFWHLPVYGWVEYRLNIDSDQVRFTGINHSTSSLPSLITFLQNQQLLNTLPDDEIPNSTYMFAHLSISDLLALKELYFSRIDNSVYVINDSVNAVLEDNIGKDAFVCCFTGEGDDQTTFNSVLSISLANSKKAQESFNQLLREDKASLLSYIGKYHNYKLYRMSFKTNDSLMLNDNDKYLCIYEKRLLLSSTPEDLENYIAAINDKQKFSNSSVFNQRFFRQSSVYNYMLMVDFSILNNQLENRSPLIPEFMLKHLDMYKDFIFTVQFSRMNNTVFSIMTFQYKNESV